jgi:parvulin-like peptidyl-prolyl isomerase
MIRSQSHRAYIFLFCLASALLLVAGVVGKSPGIDGMKSARASARPWYMRKIEISNVVIPVSPVSLIVLLVSAFYLVYFWTGKPEYVVASHILLDDPTSDENEEKLEEWKLKIGKDAILFAKYARQYSSCPSKSKGGNLGKFTRDTMFPTFDRACFDPQSPVETAIGPVRSTFGWHLIYIHERYLASNK